MAVLNSVSAFHDEMVEWRRDLHAHPELQFETKRTAGVVTDKLRAFGVDELHHDLAKNSVIGVIHGQHPGHGAIALRADMDALPMHEESGVAWQSTTPGRMHACGHDGHTTMLLGAAKYLAETRNFAGSVYLIFQPAEEGGGGAEVMVKNGLFDKFPIEQVYGMHNWPGHDEGTLSAIPGPMMAAVDSFCIDLVGKGGHAAMPHTTQSPLVTASMIVVALSGVIANNVPARQSAVISVTRIAGGDAYNVIPEKATIWGTLRTYDPAIRDVCCNRMETLINHTAAAYDMQATARFMHGYPATINTEAETAHALDVARDVIGEDAVIADMEPSMGSEDFSYMLNERPGCYIWLGTGQHETGQQLHGPTYDFNDNVLTVGASYWARLVEKTLAAKDAA